MLSICGLHRGIKIKGAAMNLQLLMNLSWSQPWAFLLFIPWAVFVFWYFKKLKTKSTFQVSRVQAFVPWKGRGRSQFVFLNELLLMFSLVLMILALARPQTSDAKVKRTLDGLDIVIVLDVSDSMLIEDMKPDNRLESAKKTIAEFVQKRNSDRIGLVIFAGEAFTLVPPTLDYQLLLERVGQIQTAQQARIKDGTAIGVAMAAGAARLKDSQAKSRVMIFLTDGENNSGTIDPETGLEIAKGYGIKIYSIGIGKSGPTKLPIYTQDAFGNKVKRYQNFESTVNDELLTQMGKVTGGKYFRATKDNSLQSVFDEINQLETTKIEETKYTKYNEYFTFFLFWAILFFILSRILSYSVLRRGPA
jgi:Ca-activated chloride channel family protein